LDQRELLGSHPLFRRLPGQVIWTLFEEYGAPAKDIDAFLEHWFALRDHCLGVMHRLASDLSGAVKISITGPGKSCAHCQALDGRMLPCRGVAVFPLLPPYGLGCRARPEYLVPDEARLLEGKTIRQEEVPAHLLHCPSEWLFSHPWSAARG